MLRVLVLAVLASLAAPSFGQAAPPADRGPTPGHRVALAVGALGGGFLVAIVVPPAAPLGVVAGTYGMGRSLGFDASFGSVVVDAAVGGAVGFGVGAATLYVVSDGETGSGLGEALFSAAAGLAAGAVTTAMLYDGRRVEVAPAVLAVPGGDRAPGLALRVRL